MDFASVVSQLAKLSYRLMEISFHEKGQSSSRPAFENVFNGYLNIPVDFLNIILKAKN